MMMWQITMQKWWCGLKFLVDAFYGQMAMKVHI
jgi:hypothetical protein